MACTGNCEICNSPCPAAERFLKRISSVPPDGPAGEDKTQNGNKQECKKQMSDFVKLTGCGASADPEHIKCSAAILELEKENKRLQAELSSLGASTPLCTSIKSIVYLSCGIALIALILATMGLAVTLAK